MQKLHKFREFNLLTTEYTGLDKNGVYKPKSLERLNGESYSVALKGICKGWSDFPDYKGLFSTDSAKLSKSENHEFMEFLLYFWLVNFNQELSKHLVPVFQEKSSNLPYARGRVDYNRFELQAHQSILNLKCLYTDLTFDVSELSVIKDGYLKIIRNISECSILEKAISCEASKGLQLLSKIPSSANPVYSARKIMCKYGFDEHFQPTQISLPFKIRSLEDIIVFFSRFLTESFDGSKSDTKSFNGFLFNLNDLLEKVVRKALGTIYSDKSVENNIFPKNVINNISVRSKSGRTYDKSMNPDCVGVFSKMDFSMNSKLREALENNIYILDAKHKMFFEDGRLLPVKREDFFQIISYARTHHNQVGLDSIYGLIGLEEEFEVINNDSFDTRRYVDNNLSTCSVIDISFDSNNLKVFQIPIKFSQVLYDLGISKEGESMKIYESLGKDLARVLADLKTTFK